MLSSALCLVATLLLVLSSLVEPVLSSSDAALKSSQCRLFVDSNFATLDNGLFSSTFVLSTGEQTSWRAPHVAPNVDFLAPNGQAQWNADTGAPDWLPNNMRFEVRVNRSDLVHIAFTEPAAGVDGHPNYPYFNWSMHYVMVADLAGLYTWSLLERNSTAYPEGESWDIVEYRYVARLNHGTAEAAYTDNPFDHVRISDWRNTDRLQPNFQQQLDGRSGTVVGEPKEVEYCELNDGTRRFIHKYDTCLSSLEHKVFGWYNQSSHVGLWLLTPDYSYKNGAWLNQELTAYGPTTGTSSLFAIIQYTNGEHYGSGEQPISLSAPSSYRKIHGPFLMYANCASDNDALWQNALAQHEAEVAKWPYDFVDEAEYVAAVRTVVTGRVWMPLSEVGPDQPQDMSGILVVLTQPEATDGPVSLQSRGYWYYNYTNATGHFTIRHVLPDEYEIHITRNGTFGNHTHSQLFNTSGMGGGVLDVGLIRWWPTRYGPTMWEIGRPDYDTREFFHGQYANNWAMYALYPLYYSHGTHYHVDMNQSRQQQIEQWATQWHYEHVPVAATPSYPPHNDNMTDTTWHVYFNTTVDPTQLASVSLRIGFAGIVQCGLLVTLNGQRVATWLDLQRHSDGSVYRDQSFGQYVAREENVTAGVLVERGAENVLELKSACVGSLFNDGLQYDYLRMEAIYADASSAVA